MPSASPISDFPNSFMEPEMLSFDFPSSVPKRFGGPSSRSAFSTVGFHGPSQCDIDDAAPKSSSSNNNDNNNNSNNIDNNKNNNNDSYSSMSSSSPTNVDILNLGNNGIVHGGSRSSTSRQLAMGVSTSISNRNTNYNSLQCFNHVSGGCRMTIKSSEMNSSTKSVNISSSESSVCQTVTSVDKGSNQRNDKRGSNNDNSFLPLPDSNRIHKEHSLICDVVVTENDYRSISSSSSFAPLSSSSSSSSSSFSSSSPLPSSSSSSSSSSLVSRKLMINNDKNNDQSKAGGVMETGTIKRNQNATFSSKNNKNDNNDKSCFNNTNDKLCYNENTVSALINTRSSSQLFTPNPFDESHTTNVYTNMDGTESHFMGHLPSSSLPSSSTLSSSAIAAPQSFTNSKLQHDHHQHLYHLNDNHHHQQQRFTTSASSQHHSTASLESSLFATKPLTSSLSSSSSTKFILFPSSSTISTPPPPPSASSVSCLYTTDLTPSSDSLNPMDSSCTSSSNMDTAPARNLSTSINSSSSASDHPISAHASCNSSTLISYSHPLTSSSSYSSTSYSRQQLNRAPPTSHDLSYSDPLSDGIYPLYSSSVGNSDNDMDDSCSSRIRKKSFPCESSDHFLQDEPDETDDTAMSWTLKAPQFWSSSEVLDWLFYVAQEQGLDMQKLRAENFQSVSGERLCQMDPEDFTRLEPSFGMVLFEMLHKLMSGECYIKLETSSTKQFGYSRPSPTYSSHSDSNNFDMGGHLTNHSQPFQEATPFFADIKQEETSCVYQGGPPPVGHHYFKQEEPDNLSMHFTTQYNFDVNDSPQSCLNASQGLVPYPGDCYLYQHGIPSYPHPQSCPPPPPPSQSSHNNHQHHHPSSLPPPPPPCCYSVPPPPPPPPSTLPRRKPGRPRVKNLIQAAKGSKDKKAKNQHLWEFIYEILMNPMYNPQYLKWENQREGVFRFVQSEAVAQLWGGRKNNENMTYEKLSRAMRHYYRRGILERVEGRRLVYKFSLKAIERMKAKKNNTS